MVFFLLEYRAAAVDRAVFVSDKQSRSTTGPKASRMTEFVKSSVHFACKFKPCYYNAILYYHMNYAHYKAVQIHLQTPLHFKTRDRINTEQRW